MAQCQKAQEKCHIKALLKLNSETALQWQMAEMFALNVDPCGLTIMW